MGLARDILYYIYACDGKVWPSYSRVAKLLSCSHIQPVCVYVCVCGGGGQRQYCEVVLPWEKAALCFTVHPEEFLSEETTN